MVDPIPLRACFGDFLMAYAAVAATNTDKHGRCQVLIGPIAYDRAEATGLLAEVRKRYPELTITRGGGPVRGCHPRFMVYDEVAAFNAACEEALREHAERPVE